MFGAVFAFSPLLVDIFRIALIVAPILIVAEPTRAVAADYQIIEINPGQTVDVYFEINLAGTVALRIATRSGPGCAELWWIKWPLGNIESLGRRCGSMRLRIPGIANLAIAGKLRAAGVDKRTKIVAAATEQVANSVTIPW